VTPGVTVADLEQRGATALGDAELSALLVGKSTWLANSVTRDKFLISWSPDGQRQLKYVNPKVPQPSEVGEVAQGGYLGLSSNYQIKGGKIVAFVGSSPFETTVYKLGDKYYAARSNEFGFANYEVIPVQAEVSPLAAGARPIK
jgi:hypothetical protein